MNFKDSNGRIQLQNLLRNQSGIKVDIVEKLLTLGSNLKTTDNDNETLLHAACISGNLAVIQYLASKGLDVTAKTKTGDTLLHLAARHQNPILWQWLCDQGVDINAINNSGESAIDIAIKKYPELIKPQLIKEIKLTFDQQKEFLSNILGGIYTNFLIYVAMELPQFFDEFFSKKKPELIEELNILVDYLNSHPMANFTAPVIIALLTALSSQNNEGDTIRPMHSVLIYIAKRTPQAFLDLTEARGTSDEKKYINACSQYIVHLTDALHKNPNDGLAKQKREIVLNALHTLLTINTPTSEQRISNFKQVLIADKDTLCLRRDHLLLTFIKAIGVLGASIFGFGVGGFIAYKKLFGKQATDGGKLLDAVEIQDNKKPGA